MRRVRVPLGVIAMIYEARPNVTVEASALCLKAGNAVVLRGGSEAARSNAAIVAVVGGRARARDLSRGTPCRRCRRGTATPCGSSCSRSETVDLVIPRGGEALIRFVREHARVPVIAHAKGVCHLFVDAGADVGDGDAPRGQRQAPAPGRVQRARVPARRRERRAAPAARPSRARCSRAGCELRGCERTRRARPARRPATDDDWGREYLDRVLAVRVVDGLDGALEHVARYGSRHTEAICTRDAAHAADAGAARSTPPASSSTPARASTTAASSASGAEIGIATTKLHWRGAMGLEALTTFQWQLDGDGQTRG